MRFLNTILLLAASITILAQDVNFNASAPKYVRVGEQFQVQYSVNRSIDDFRPPSFENFDFLGGPMQGSSTNISVINGKTVRNQTFTFTYYLRARQAGTFTLAPATVKYKKNNIESNSVSIEVVGNSSSSSNSSQANASGEKSPTAAGSNNEEIFVRFVTDKRSAYVGESITGWIKIYTKVSLSDIDRNFKGPVFSGFYKQDIEIPPLSNLEREKVGNDIYYTGVLQKVVLFPQRSGKLKIDPFDLTIYMQKQVRQSRSVFDDFFGPSYTSVPVKLKSKAITIDVRPLPTNPPEGFSGAVGTFSLKGSLNSSKVKTNDAVSFKLTLRGTGNIKLVESLDYSLPSTMQVYDPIVKTNIDKSGKSGSKVFEITAIPRHAGIINIKPFKLIYFDTKTKTFKTVQTQPFTLEVERGEGDSSSVIISNLSKEDVELLGSDIRYIKSEVSLNKKGVYILDKFIYRLLFLIPLVILIVLIFFKKDQIKKRTDASQTKHRKANKLARRRLKTSNELLKQNKIDQFYEEISKALWGYISDKLNIPQSSLSSESARQAFLDNRVDANLVEELFSTISSCEFARYAPGASEKEPKDVYADVVKLLMQIEQNF